MARTTRKIKRLCEVDETIKRIERIFSSHCYKMRLVKGEKVWAYCEDAICCFAYSFDDENVILQGWILDMLFGELELEGFFAGAAKKQMKEIMSEVEASLYRDLPKTTNEHRGVRLY